MTQLPWSAVHFCKVTEIWRIATPISVISFSPSFSGCRMTCTTAYLIWQYAAVGLEGSNKGCVHVLYMHTIFSYKYLDCVMKFQVPSPGARVFHHLNLLAAPPCSPQCHRNHSIALGLSSLKTRLCSPTFDCCIFLAWACTLVTQNMFIRSLTNTVESATAKNYSLTIQEIKQNYSVHGAFQMTRKI